MIKRIDNICRVDFCKLEDIFSPLTESLPGEGHTIGTSWASLDIAPGSVIIITPSLPESGRQYEVNFTGTLRTVPSFIAELGLVRITLEDGLQLLIGDQDLPVRLFDDHTLKGKNISFTHFSWHYPYQITTLSGSGSSGSGL